MINIEAATHEELLIEYTKCQIMWGLYSCDCFGFYLTALNKKITELGGWPIKNELKQ